MPTEVEVMVQRPRMRSRTTTPTYQRSSTPFPIARGRGPLFGVGRGSAPRACAYQSVKARLAAPAEERGADRPATATGPAPTQGTFRREERATDGHEDWQGCGGPTGPPRRREGPRAARHTARRSGCSALWRCAGRWRASTVASPATPRRFEGRTCYTCYSATDTHLRSLGGGASAGPSWAVRSRALPCRRPFGAALGRSNPAYP